MSILVTGAAGQIGSELLAHLSALRGGETIIATDINVDRIPGDTIKERLDVCDAPRVEQLFDAYQVSEVYHLAAILSGVGEKNPQLAYNVNMNGTFAILEAARKLSVSRLFAPSSIAVYGRGIDRENTVDDSPLNPSTMYGVTKVASEQLFSYYRSRYGLDVRSLRFPGVISWKTEPGGGSTDYAVDIFRQAILKNSYTSFVTEDTKLPFMYMPDVLNSIVTLMQAPNGQIKRSSYNVNGFNASLSDFAGVVTGHIPGFELQVEPDFRQDVVDSWPRVLNDEQARRDWGWSPAYDLHACSEDMLANLSRSLKAGGSSNIKEAS